jgi:hypothetical protein
VKVCGGIVIVVFILWNPFGWHLAYSPNDFIHHAPMHVCEPEVAPLKAVGELFVVKAELVQQRGV